MNFLINLLKGILISVIGSVLVYVLVFALISGKPIRDLKDAKMLFNDIVSVREKIALLNSRSALMAEKTELENSLVDSADEHAQNEIKKAMADIEIQLQQGTDLKNKLNFEDTTPPPLDNLAAATASELYEVRKDLNRLQNQLDRVENNNRLLNLQIKLLQKQNEHLIQSRTRK